MSPSMTRLTGLTGLIVLCWAIGSLPQFGRHLSGWPIAVAVVLGAVLVAVGIALLRRALISGFKLPRVTSLVAFWALMLVLFLVLHPISERHTIGIGSDGEDALRVAASQLAQGRYPYAARTYLGNPITPLPGAILLALPFEWMGNVGLQNAAWLAVFMAVCSRWFRRRKTTLAFLIVMVLGNLVTLNQFVTGGDYTTNLWYVCSALLIFLRTIDERRSLCIQLAAGALLGIALSSRLVYPLVLVPLLAAYLLQRYGLFRACRSLSVPLLTMLAITVPFYWHDPAQFAPLLVARQKLDFLSPQEARAALILLPVLAVLIACGGFLAPLSLATLFLMAGISSACVLLVPAAWMLLQPDTGPFNWTLLSYANTSVTLAALWAFHEFEDGFSSQSRPRQGPTG